MRVHKLFAMLTGCVSTTTRSALGESASAKIHFAATRLSITQPRRFFATPILLKSITCLKGARSIQILCWLHEP